VNIKNKVHVGIIIILWIIITVCTTSTIIYRYSKNSKLDTTIRITLTLQEGNVLQRSIYSTLINSHCSLSTEEQNRLMKILDELNNKINSKVDQNFKNREK